MMRKSLSALTLALCFGFAPAWAQDAAEVTEAVVEAVAPVAEAVAEEAAEPAVSVEQKAAELAYALDTFYFLVFGAFVMWMAAGFAMLESGLVRAKNTAEILTKNIGLFAIASVMYMIW
jgi:ammonium transporter, Amt family